MCFMTKHIALFSSVLQSNMASWFTEFSGQLDLMVNLNPAKRFTLCF